MSAKKKYRRSNQEVDAICGEWMASGLSVSDFCSQRKLRRASMYQWLRTRKTSVQASRNTSEAPSTMPRGVREKAAQQASTFFEFQLPPRTESDTPRLTIYGRNGHSLVAEGVSYSVQELAYLAKELA
jgi:hypothetical protein